MLPSDRTLPGIGAPSPAGGTRKPEQAKSEDGVERDRGRYTGRNRRASAESASGTCAVRGGGFREGDFLNDWHTFSEAINLHVEGRIAGDDAHRQERSAREILRRLAAQP